MFNIKYLLWRGRGVQESFSFLYPLQGAEGTGKNTSDEAYKNKKFDSIYDRLPLEYSGSIQQDEYKGKVVNFLEEYSSKELSNIDLKIIEEVQWFFCSFSFKLIKLIDM